MEKLKSFFKEDGLSSSEDDEKPPKRRRRKAGEISGRQLALKKIEEEAAGAHVTTTTWPPPFTETVKAMRMKLQEFAKGKNDDFSEDEAQAMRVYFQRRFKVSGTVSLKCVAV